VGGNDDAFAIVAGKRCEDIKHRIFGVAVQIARRLVGYDDVGVVRQRPCDSDTLLLAAGQFQHFSVCRFPVYADLFKQRVDVFFFVFLPVSADAHGKHDVFDRRGVGEQIKALENDSYVFRPVIVAVELFQALALIGNLAVGADVQSGDKRQQSGLARSGFADNSVYFTV
jgi:hypothetical protein